MQKSIQVYFSMHLCKTFSVPRRENKEKQFRGIKDAINARASITSSNQSTNAIHPSGTEGYIYIKRGTRTIQE